MADSDDIVAALRELFSRYFASNDDGDPLDDWTKVYIAFYDLYDPVWRGKVKKPIDTEDPNSPEASFRYRMRFDPVPVRFVADADGAPALDPDWKPSGKGLPVHLWHSRILVDPVHDDLLEMTSAGFPYADLLASMSDSARRTYNENLDKIVDRPAPLETDEEGVEFIKALANYGTYDSDGDYFTKWRPGKQNGTPLAEAVTPRYIQNSFREVELEEHSFYVLRQNELFSEIDLLYADDDGVVRKAPYYGQKNNRYELTQYKKDAPLHESFVFVYALNGAPRSWRGKVPRPRPWRSEYDVHNPKGHAALRRMIDVRRWVEAAVADGKTQSSLNLGDEFEWFVEYAKAHFPNRVSIIRISEIEKRGWTTTRMAYDTVHAMLVDKLQESMKNADDVGGPISRAVVAKMLELMKDPDVLVFPQGLKTGDHSRFLGGDEDFMFERDLHNGSVYFTSTTSYIYNLYVGKVAFDVYEATKWLIPFIAVIEWGALIVLGVGVLGISAAAIRTFVVEQVEKMVGSELIKRLLVKFFRPAIIALLVELVAYIFRVAPELLVGEIDILTGIKIDTARAKEIASRTEHFAKGFFRGYVVRNLYDHLLKDVVVGTLEKGVANIREVKMYLLTKKIYHAVDKVQDVVRKLERELDGPTMHEAIRIFQEVIVKITRGAALLFSTVYLLPHDQAKPFLDVFGLDPDQKPPDPNVWAAEAQKQMANVSDAFTNVTDGLKSLDETLGDIEKALPAIGAVMVLESEIIWAAEWTYEHLPKKWKTFVLCALVSFAAVGYEIANEKTDGKLWDTTKTLIGDFFHLPRNDDEAELDGELVGNVFGAFMLNSALFDKGGPFHDFRESHPLLGGALWGNIKASPTEAIITLVLKRYVYLYEQLKKVVGPLATREGGEQAFLGAIQAFEDKALEDEGYGQLKSFRTDGERQASLQNIALTIYRVRKVIAADIEEWLKATYKDTTRKYKDDLLAFNKLARSATGVDFQQVIEKDIPMVYHQAALLIHQALTTLWEAIQALFTPFSKGGLSWISFLKELGVDVGDIDKIQEQVMASAKGELNGFKKT